MTLYLWIKLLHILSATVLFGTGMGTAFFMLKAYLSANDEAMAVTTRSVVMADWIFTTPAVVMQLRNRAVAHAVPQYFTGLGSGSRRSSVFSSL